MRTLAWYGTSMSILAFADSEHTDPRVVKMVPNDERIASEADIDIDAEAPSPGRRQRRRPQS